MFDVVIVSHAVVDVVLVVGWLVWVLIVFVVIVFGFAAIVAGVGVYVAAAVVSLLLL